MHYGCWAVPPEVLQPIKTASETSDEVFLFFAVGSSRHYQGVARLVKGALATIDVAAGEDLATEIVPYEGDGKSAWSGAFGIEWLRICECPWERLARFENKLVTVPEWYDTDLS